MKNIKFNEDWQFWCDRNSFALVWNVPEEARKITLPHDAMIEAPAREESANGGNTGFRDGEIYVYVKNYFASEEDRGKTLFLKFEGIYMNAFIYVNGQLAAKSPFGYTDIYADLSPYLKYGSNNEIRVMVRNGAMANSRWYSGGGIYRDVYFLSAGLCYFVPGGAQIRTERIEKNGDGEADYAVLSVRTELKNRKAEKTALRQRIVIRDENGTAVACDETPVTLYEQEESSLTRRITVDAPALWGEEHPTLYTAECTLLDDKTEEILDEDTETFGIRVLGLDVRKGLTVNGETVKLRGACIHHDSGLLGAATYEEVEYREIQRLKEAGFNAIRMSHHPMAPAMLRACDALGVFVMDETFDMWNRQKSGYDYSLYFREWWQKDIAAMVRKDYNHPCVVLYSIGNEIPEIGTEQGSKYCHDINEFIKGMDDTRYTLASINGVYAAEDLGAVIADLMSDSDSGKDATGGNVNDFMTIMDTRMDDIVRHREVSRGLERPLAYLDVAGYNYMTARYVPDGEAYPNRVIVGSETYPPQIAENWQLVEKLPYVIGDFTWTGWDYIGEAGIGIPAYAWGEGGFGARFPAQLAYCGDIDITGFRRPASYFREEVYGRTATPYIAVQDPHHYGEFLIKTPWIMSDAVASWNWSGCEGKPVVIEVYAAGDEVELLRDDISLGRKESGKKAGYLARFETVYQPGKLTAIAYENGEEIGRNELVSAVGEASLHIEREVNSKEEKFIFLNITLEDENGTVYTDRDTEITLTAPENVIVRGFGSGNPKPKYGFDGKITELYNGRAQIIIEKPADGKKVTLSVLAATGEKAVITV